MKPHRPVPGDVPTRNPADALDVSRYAAPSAGADASPFHTVGGPVTVLTTVGGTAPVEFAALGGCHHFNLQLSAPLLVQAVADGRGRTRLVAPGHVSLNVADESFRCVVWPAPDALTLHAVLPPAWVSAVREQEMGGGPVSGSGLTPQLGEWDDRLRSIALRLTEAVRFGAADRLRVDRLHLELAVELVRRHSGGRVRPHPPGRLAPGTLRRVIDYLHAHLGETVPLADLAAVGGLSPFHFARAFKATVGVPPHRYLTEMRLAQARVLLASTERPVSAIALGLGFDTPSHFCTAFRARVGTSPSAFRLGGS